MMTMVGNRPIERVRVISLVRTPERRRQFMQRNGRLPLEFVDAVDGRALDRSACIGNGLITADNLYNPGALGHAASQIALWRKCADENRPMHIAEDDAILRHDFIEFAADALAQLTSWDYVLWGWNFDWPMKVRLAPGLGSTMIGSNQVELRENWPRFQNGRVRPTLARLSACSGTCCYSLSPEGARRLLGRVLPIGAQPTPFAVNKDVRLPNTTLDLELSRHFEHLVAFVALPCLAVSLNIHEESTILNP